jgi:hypothetical protein
MTVTWSGLPATAIIVAQQGPTSTGPWTTLSVSAPLSSPQTLTGFTTAQFGRAILYDPTTNAFLTPSNSVVIM